MPVLVLCLSSGALIASGMSLVRARRAFHWIVLGPSHATRQALRELTRRSIPIVLFQLGALAVNETQVIILARRCGLSLVTDYSVAFRLYAVLISLIQLGTASFVPPLREARERGDHAWALRAFRNLLGFRMVLAVGAGIGLVALGNLVLRFWLGREDMRFGLEIWGAFALLLLASVWSTAFSDLLWIMDRLWPLVGLVLLNGAVTVGLTWWLAPSQGVTGAALASAVFPLAVSSWALPRLARPLLLAPATPPAPGGTPAR
jgi:O-antigen/teichoic acid export membrane protein